MSWQRRLLSTLLATPSSPTGPKTLPLKDIPTRKPSSLLKSRIKSILPRSPPRRRVTPLPTLEPLSVLLPLSQSDPCTPPAATRRHLTPRLCSEDLVEV